MTPRRLYELYGLCTLLASSISFAAMLVAAPRFDWIVTIGFNGLGEGWLELFIVLLAVPSWTMIVQDAVKRDAA